MDIQKHPTDVRMDQIMKRELLPTQQTKVAIKSGDITSLGRREMHKWIYGKGNDSDESSSLILLILY